MQTVSEYEGELSGACIQWLTLASAKLPHFARTVNPLQRILYTRMLKGTVNTDS